MTGSDEVLHKLDSIVHEIKLLREVHLEINNKLLGMVDEHQNKVPRSIFTGTIALLVLMIGVQFMVYNKLQHIEFSTHAVSVK
jgi:p-aminobenzoyl-glutamate transporter AbgT